MAKKIGKLLVETGAITPEQLRAALRVQLQRGGHLPGLLRRLALHREGAREVQSAGVKGCRTFYLFPPRALAPGAAVVVHVALDREGKTAAVPVRPLPRTGVTAETTGAPGLRLRAGDKTWSFRPLFGIAPTAGMPIPSGSAMKEAWAAAVDLAARLLGDFDQALRAFDAPELLQDMPVRRTADRSTVTGKDAP